MNNSFQFNRNILQPQLDLDTSKDKNGQSTQVTGFIETVNEDGTRKINVINDGEVFTDVAAEADDNNLTPYNLCGDGFCECTYNTISNKWYCNPFGNPSSGLKGCNILNECGCPDLNAENFGPPVNPTIPVFVNCTRKPQSPPPPQGTLPWEGCRGQCFYTWNFDPTSPHVPGQVPPGTWTVTQDTENPCNPSCDCPPNQFEPNIYTGFQDGQRFSKPCEKTRPPTTPQPTPIPTQTCGTCTCNFMMDNYVPSFSITQSGYWDCKQTANFPCGNNCRCPTLSPGAGNPGDYIVVNCIPPAATPQYTPFPTPEPTPDSTPIPTQTLPFGQYRPCKGECIYSWNSNLEKYQLKKGTCTKANPILGYTCDCDWTLDEMPYSNDLITIKCMSKWMEPQCLGKCKYKCLLNSIYPIYNSNTCSSHFGGKCIDCPVSNYLFDCTYSDWIWGTEFTAECSNLRLEPPNQKCGVCWYKWNASTTYWEFSDYACGSGCTCTRPTYSSNDLKDQEQYAVKCAPNLGDKWMDDGRCYWEAKRSLAGLGGWYWSISWSPCGNQSVGCQEPSEQPSFDNQRAITACVYQSVRD